MEDESVFAKDRVRFEMMRHIDYFVGESIGHFSEYIPYFKAELETSSEMSEDYEVNRVGKYCASVSNTQLITVLPDECCVEVPCLVDQTGIHPCRVGDLPPQCASLNCANIQNMVDGMFDAQAEYLPQF